MQGLRTIKRESCATGAVLSHQSDPVMLCVIRLFIGWILSRIEWKIVPDGMETPCRAILLGFLFGKRITLIDCN